MNVETIVYIDEGANVYISAGLQCFSMKHIFMKRLQLHIYEGYCVYVHRPTCIY